MKYFVCAIHPDDFSPILMMDENNQIILFDTEDEANYFAKNDFICQFTGFKILEWRVTSTKIY